MITGALAHFECEPYAHHDGGDHVIFLGAVEAYAYNRDEPLLFLRGDFGRFSGDDARNKSEE